MNRFVLLTILNLMLPFLVQAAWVSFLRLRHKQKVKKQPEIIDVTPPEWRFPVFKLLGVGLVLLALSLLVWRFSEMETDTTWENPNPAASREY